MSSCEAIRERLTEAGAEALDELPEVKRHLEGCSACSDAWIWSHCRVGKGGEVKSRRMR